MSIAERQQLLEDTKHYPDAPHADYSDEVTEEQFQALKKLAAAENSDNHDRKIVESVDW